MMADLGRMSKPAILRPLARSSARLVALLGLVALALPGCGRELWEPCSSSSDCRMGLQCTGGVCYSQEAAMEQSVAINGMILRSMEVSQQIYAGKTPTRAECEAIAVDPKSLYPGRTEYSQSMRQIFEVAQEQMVAGCMAAVEDEGARQRPRDQCDAFADKVVELTVQGEEGASAEMARSMIEAMRPEMVKECREKGSPAEIECALRAQSLDELERCGS